MTKRKKHLCKCPRCEKFFYKVFRYFGTVTPRIMCKQCTDTLRRKEQQTIDHWKK